MVTAEAEITPISATRPASIFPAIKRRTRVILTAYFASVRYTIWAKNAVVITRFWLIAARIAARVCCRTGEKIMS